MGLADSLSYATPRFALIFDTRLALLRWSFLLSIICYILVYDILYRGRHLQLSDGDGIFRLQLQQPTMGGCNPLDADCQHNFTSLSELHYCNESQLESSKTKHPCRYIDALGLKREKDGGMLIPTHVITYNQRQHCDPSASSKWECAGTLWNSVDTNGNVLPDGKEKESDVFVADIDRFTLLLEHSVKWVGVARPAMASTEMDGYWLECPEISSKDMIADVCKYHPVKKLIKQETEPVAPTSALQMLEMNLRQSSQPSRKGKMATRDQDEAKLPEFYEIDNGDVFSLEHLLAMAKSHLDDEMEDGRTYRERGLVLVVDIEYTNRWPGRWMGLDVLPWQRYGSEMWYTYRATLRPSDGYKYREMDAGILDTKRRITEYKGIRLIVKQSGSLATWDFTGLLVAATASVGLLALSNTITDFLALNCLQNSEQYQKMKFVEFRAEEGQPDSFASSCSRVTEHVEEA
eukprot:gnl/TRDRNA2_/TRDRNA2_180764_c0_seq1.p1 gnl/TRDRNA2_/TRDRNA2_180764_c0~~gnl/TRDRNA2_/TRDRNA2_180764_c0_seq1.p1  ORF type:complete len:462 (+),score=65.72 gnl/TRDRNA2_/TRDRNA2_180764_c0_seq1:92-1477(+)